jgi:DNA polymerase-3 subunit gamma/tau
MPYLSLYRKYRPRSFAEVLGQRHVTQTLANAVKSGRIVHAYLFCGPRGTGKTSTARLLAMALNCEHGPTPEPCGKCETCERIVAGTALDVIEIDAASNRGIDEIRSLREKVALAPADARMKVYIIDEVHMLTPEAYNAFLKTLEEPPAHVVFVLATTEPHRVLPTILSRCQRFDFHRLGVPEIESNLRMVASKEGIALDDTAITMVAHAADGSARDALTLLDQAIAYAEGRVTPEVVVEILGGIDFDLLAEFAALFTRHDVSGALALVDRVVAEGKDLRQLLSGLIGHYRNLLVLSVDRRAKEALLLPEEVVSKIAEQAQALSPEVIVRTLDLLAETDREMRFTSQPRLLVELCAVRICGAPSPPRARLGGGAPAHAAEGGPSAVAGPVLSTVEGKEPEERPAEAVAEEAASELEPGCLADIRGRWDELVSDLRKHKHTSEAAFIREATPAALEDDVLVLAFKHEFHHDQMAGDEKRQRIVTEAVKRVFGREVKLKCRLALPEEGTPPSAHPQPIQDLMALFPGSEVEGPP